MSWLVADSLTCRPPSSVPLTVRLAPAYLYSMLICASPSEAICLERTYPRTRYPPHWREPVDRNEPTGPRTALLCSSHWRDGTLHHQPGGVHDGAPVGSLCHPELPPSAEPNCLSLLYKPSPRFSLNYCTPNGQTDCLGPSARLFKLAHYLRGVS